MPGVPPENLYHACSKGESVGYFGMDPFPRVTPPFMQQTNIISTSRLIDRRLHQYFTNAPVHRHIDSLILTPGYLIQPPVASLIARTKGSGATLLNMRLS